MRGSVAAMVAVGVSCLACLGPRDPGPLEEEWGQVLFWEVTGTDSANEDCTDAAGFADALVLPPLLPNTFFVVRLADDGKTATATDCTETRASSCTDLDGFDFAVNGNTLTHSEPLIPVESDAGCDVSLASVWTMVDGGEEGSLEVALTFPFDGEAAACDALDAAVVAQGNNGFGLEACTVVLNADLAFVTAD